MYSSSKSSDIRNICERVSEDVEKVWRRASVPTIARKSIVDKTKRAFNKYCILIKIPKSRPSAKEKFPN